MLAAVDVLDEGVILFAVEDGADVHEEQFVDVRQPVDLLFYALAKN